MTSGIPRNKTRMQAAVVAAAVVAAIWPAVGKDKNKDAEAAASPVIARVNGEDVTKADFDAIMKANQRFYDLTSSGVRDKLKGRPLADFLFREEVVKIRAVAQKNAEALPAMKAAIEEARQKIAGGADFGVVAKEVSQDPASAARGGSLGDPQGFFDFVHPFNRVALSLKEGQLSDPVLTVFGYHLIKVDKIFPPMELHPKRVQLRHILIRYPAGATDPRQEAEQLANAAKVEITDPTYCKKLTSYCAEGAGL